LTDGFVSDLALGMIGVIGGVRCKRLAHVLVEAGLFERVEGGFMVHDYLDHNQSKALVIERREQDAERKRTDSVRNPGGILAESGRNPEPRARASHPIPSHPKEEEETKPDVVSTSQDVVQRVMAAKKSEYGRLKPAKGYRVR
jgi:hypothetical protein